VATVSCKTCGCPTEATEDVSESFQCQACLDHANERQKLLEKIKEDIRIKKQQREQKEIAELNAKEERRLKREAELKQRREAKE
jgi:hypothetical protein